LHNLHDFDFLHIISESYATLRRYAPAFLDALKLRAAPTAKDMIDAIDVLRTMNTSSPAIHLDEINAQKYP